MAHIPTPQFDLRADGVPDRQRKLVTAMRCILQAASDPETPLTVAAIAQRTGLSQTSVREAVGSDECRELLEHSITGRCALALTRGLHVAVDIMVNSGNDRTRLAAFRNLIELYRVLNASAPVHDSAAGEQEVLRLLRELDAQKGSERTGA